MNMNRAIKILAGGLLGAFIGSSIGIVAMGDGVAGTAPIGILGAYLVYLWTRPEQGEREIMKKNLPPKEENGLSNDPLYSEIEKSVYDTIPILARVSAASWNFLMRIFLAIGVMPIFIQAPWLFVVLGFILLAIVFPVGIFFTVIALVAGAKGAKSENSFIISLNNGSPTDDHPLQQKEADVTDSESGTP